MVGIFQIAGILIPLAGMIALVRRGQQSESSVRLLMATVGCMLMNSGYLLFLVSEDETSAITALKMEYLGNAFFISFLFSFFYLI